MGCCTPIVAYPTAPNKLQCVGLEWYESMFSRQDGADVSSIKSYTVERSGLYKLAIAATGADVNNAELGEKGTAFAVVYLTEGDKVFFHLGGEVASFAIRGNWVNTRVADTEFDTSVPRKEAAFTMQLLTERRTVPVGLALSEMSTPSGGYTPEQVSGIRDEGIRNFVGCLCCFADGTDMGRSGVAKIVDLHRTRGVGNANAIKHNEFYIHANVNVAKAGHYKVYATGGNQVKVFINGLPVLWKASVEAGCDDRRAFAKVYLPEGKNDVCFVMDSRSPITTSNMIDALALRIVDADAEVNTPMAEGTFPDGIDVTDFRMATALKGCATLTQGQFEKEITSERNERVEEQVSKQSHEYWTYFTMPQNDGTEHFTFGNTERIEIDPVYKTPVNQPLHVLGSEVLSPAAASGNTYNLYGEVHNTVDS